ncbi:MAG: hypothetical protein IPH24_13235 [Crocinitomicaceae bacterium]|nr:hypothetical protein [Crocinitomicaceae bacterium]
MKIIPILLISLCFVACKEENSKKYTQVKVNIANYISGVPIEDITCAVYEQDALGNSTKLFSSVTTNGQFEYNFLAKKNKTYFMTCSIDLEKYKMIQFFQYVDLDKYQMNHFDFTLVEYAYLNINMINTNCENENAEMRFRYFLPKPGYTEYVYGQTIYILNAYWDDSDSPWDGCINLVGGEITQKTGRLVKSYYLQGY